MRNVLGLMAQKRRLFVLPQLVQALHARIAQARGEVSGSDPRLKAMGAVLLATAANDLTLLEVIRTRIAEHTRELAESNVDFARASIVMLAIDGMKMRESLRISAYTAEQREQIVNELLKLAEEAYR
jgi:F0F1-type ATP synthase delta subunit